MPKILRMRSKLFVPACRPEFFDKALAGNADALSIDLEDSVAERDKGVAREAAASWLAKLGTVEKSVIVRVNGLETPHFEADMEAVVKDGLDIVNVPKIESAEDVRKIDTLLEELETCAGLTRRVLLLANIESPKGLRLAAEIATASDRVVGLQIGYGDLFEPIGVDRHQRAALDHVLLQVRLAAAEAGIEAYDGAFARVADLDGFVGEAERARAFGFAGKTCVHPRQVDAANRVFGPSAEQIAFARRVVEAWDAALARGHGAVSVDGVMIDQPYAKRAAELCAMAEAI
ncbi:citrate lyase subunit beta/citryl-CoA lyase [Paraburkholderia sp. GAS199]|uniref:HpcH/HpaI aldolase/citrate lyase family protein n=1 Tax=Paraburkholderia sp. GAS199 TaxID=3035126 RepID=UPI003D249304